MIKIVLIKNESCDNVNHFNEYTGIQIVSRDFHKKEICCSITYKNNIFLFMLSDILVLDFC